MTRPLGTDVRRRVVEECSAGFPPRFSHDLALVASELVTNVVAHARGPLVLTTAFGADSVCLGAVVISSVTGEPVRAASGTPPILSSG